MRIALVGSLRPAFRILITLQFALGSSCFGAEFKTVLNRDITLREVGRLDVTNLRGGVSIQGWSQDKIRVVARQTVLAETPEEAQLLRKALDIRDVQTSRDISVSAEYGKGMDLSARLKERQTPHARMDLEILAPAGFPLNVWTVAGNISIKNWNAAVDIRTFSGAVEVDLIRKGGLKAVCPQCQMHIKAVHGPVRCLANGGSVSLVNVDGGPVYVETAGGPQFHTQVQGEQTYVSTTGSIKGYRMGGRIEFRSGSGMIDFREARGFLSGQTEFGSVFASLASWQFADKALIESFGGTIELVLPEFFSADVDLWSVSGVLSSDLPIVLAPSRSVYGPQPANRLTGKVRGGGEQLRVLSYQGDVRVHRRPQ